MAAPLEGISTFTGLYHRLDKDKRFRYQYGLDISRPAPSISTLSRVFASLTKTGLAIKIPFSLSIISPFLEKNVILLYKIRAFLSLSFIF
ncbi:transposase [Siminovitchia sp. FSL W7-1587]|uniref:transposase n=1 Tax=Siminovitchia sp. FSL W7-1587 TaxID=2954699 RepID=UPI0030D432D7